MKIFLDTNVFIYGLTVPQSNSKKILLLAEANRFQVVTSELAVKETVRVFRRILSDQEAYNALMYITKFAQVVPKRKILGKIKKFSGTIKEKDIENIATVKHFKIKFLVAYDRDYKNFNEYFTPKRFLEKIGEKAEKTEY